ncbi:hypothetical protein FVER14953_20514 [Fusarium verticillioides]|nr:hypothetical protein FVER14953_20514 [Fusarium verticillioides]
MNCWPGALDDCDNDDDLDDIEAVVCGFRVDRKESNESDAEYRGKVGFVEDKDPNSMIKPGVRPWPDYDTAVEMVEEWEKNDVHEKEEKESLATGYHTAISPFVGILIVSLFEPI